MHEKEGLSQILYSFEYSKRWLFRLTLRLGGMSLGRPSFSRLQFLFSIFSIHGWKALRTCASRWYDNGQCRPIR